MQRNLYVVRGWWWLIVAAALLGGLSAYVATKVLVTQEYQTTAIVSMAPAPQGPNGLSVTMLAATADAQLLSTVSTAQAALHRLSPSISSGIRASTLAGKISGTPSLDGELLFVAVRWSDAGSVPALTNAVAEGFIEQEKVRLLQRLSVIHSTLVTQENFLTSLVRHTGGSGPATSWLQAQYADAVSRAYQRDADATIQARLQAGSLEVAQPATLEGVQKVGPKASLNAVLGAALLALLALAVAYFSTSDYGDDDRSDVNEPLLSRVSD